MVNQKSSAKPDKDQKQETVKSGNSSKSALTMADLMKSVTSPFKTLHKGDQVEGIILKLTSSEILVDIDAKTDAVVLEKEKKNMRSLLSLLKVGDKVTVSILNPESETGNPVVSLRRFLDELTWKKLTNAQENLEVMDVYVNEKTSGGYVVSTKDGTTGFLPNSHTLMLQDGNTDLVGQRIKVYVLDLSRQPQKIVFSQKPVMDARAFEELVKGLERGKKIEVTVSNITTFGVFVSVPVKAGSETKYVDGLIHISEISWEKVETTDSIFKVGEKIDAVIIGRDIDARRIDLSIKRQSIDPFEEKAKKFVVDQKVSGTVSEVISSGVILKLEENIDGFIRREKIPPAVTYKVGDKVNATVTQVDSKKRKIMLVPVLLEKFVGYK